uniref:C3H1-type domain-containing protein n=1 Tax=Leersia perrieri TaxID=77586 RepID=A0A0D9V8A3_9ORYZ
MDEHSADDHPLAEEDAGISDAFIQSDDHPLAEEDAGISDAFIQSDDHLLAEHSGIKDFVVKAVDNLLAKDDSGKSDVVDQHLPTGITDVVVQAVDQLADLNLSDDRALVTGDAAPVIPGAAHLRYIDAAARAHADDAVITYPAPPYAITSSAFAEAGHVFPFLGAPYGPAFASTPPSAANHAWPVSTSSHDPFAAADAYFAQIGSVVAASMESVTSSSTVSGFYTITNSPSSNSDMIPVSYTTVLSTTSPSGVAPSTFPPVSALCYLPVPSFTTTRFHPVATAFAYPDPRLATGFPSRYLIPVAPPLSTGVLIPVAPPLSTGALIPVAPPLSTGDLIPLPPPREPLLSRGNENTRLCRYYFSGRHCSLGERCTFSHYYNQTRLLPSRVSHVAESSTSTGLPLPPPSSSSTATAAGRHGVFYKTKLCSEYMSGGLCLFSINCTFAHGQAELRPSCNYIRSGRTCPHGRGRGRGGDPRWRKHGVILVPGREGEGERRETTACALLGSGQGFGLLGGFGRKDQKSRGRLDKEEHKGNDGAGTGETDAL